MISETPASHPDPDIGVAPEAGKRWGVILAGGYGTHLLSITRLLAGDERPKQFCALFGGDSLLESTRKRVERSIAGERILFPLMRAHRAFFLEEAGIRPTQRIVQPLDKGTAPPIVHSLLSIAQHDSQAIVAVLPGDHYYPDESAFTAALETAFDTAARHPESVVLLGTPAREEHTEHGWIELGPSVESSGAEAFSIRSFCDRPSVRLARQLTERGALWSTLTMVGHVRAFLDLIVTARAGLANAFHCCLWKGEEIHIAESVYRRIYATDFSRDVLSLQPQRLIALRVTQPGWNDLRVPERVVEALRGAGVRDRWINEWHAAGRILARAAGPQTESD